MNRNYRHTYTLTLDAGDDPIHPLTPDQLEAWENGEVNEPRVYEVACGDTRDTAANGKRYGTLGAQDLEIESVVQILPNGEQVQVPHNVWHNGDEAIRELCLIEDNYLSKHGDY